MAEKTEISWKERPILFSAPMVRALLAGTKTQTRRVAKAAVLDDGSEYRDDDGWPLHFDEGTGSDLRAGCPYGKPGDHLWVRETLKPWTKDGALFAYAADDTKVEGDGYNFPVFPGRPYVPSIHMARCWSRITLEVTEVRVQRLHDISEDDAKAEGYPTDWHPGGPGVWLSPKQWYFELWESIHGAGSWDSNPWVWAVSFKRITP